MKALSLLLLGATLIPSAFGSTYFEFDARATTLLTAVFSHCPVQFIQAMKGANRVGKATFQAPRPGRGRAITETYEVTTVGGGFAPTFTSYKVATLKIHREQVLEQPTTPDKPAQWKVRCELISHR